MHATHLLLIYLQVRVFIINAISHTEQEAPLPYSAGSELWKPALKNSVARSRLKMAHRSYPLNEIGLCAWIALLSFLHNLAKDEASQIIKTAEI